MSVHAGCPQYRNKLGEKGTETMMSKAIGKRSALLLAMIVAALALTSGVALAAGDGSLITCNEVEDPCLGSGNPETITGTDTEDAINALAGDDRVYGHAEADTIYGGPGNDRLTGELGSDDVYGGGGIDTIDAATDPEDQPGHEIFLDTAVSKNLDPREIMQT
jgi:Ca2+-binding RTX toxin-like protein